MVAKVGTDVFGNEMTEKLRTVGIDVTHVTRTSASSSGVAQITVSNDGTNSIIVVPGANALLSIEDVNKAEPLFVGAKYPFPCASGFSILPQLFTGNKVILILSF